MKYNRKYRINALLLTLFIINATIIFYSHMIYCYKILCVKEPYLYAIKNPIDLSWNDYIHEIMTLNQRINYTFLTLNTNYNNDVKFYIKNKKIKINDFDLLPLHMKAYSHNEWVEVGRVEAKYISGFDKYINRTVFYEGKVCNIYYL
jgi:hypothetical protein